MKWWVGWLWPWVDKGGHRSPMAWFESAPWPRRGLIHDPALNEAASAAATPFFRAEDAGSLAVADGMRSQPRI
jgi:hypothetical protein